jgi:hypothetical protein
MTTKPQNEGRRKVLPAPVVLQPKTAKAPAAKDGIDQKLAALAAKAGAAETELKRVLTDVREPADLRFFANREDKAAKAAMKVADAAEGVALDANERAAEKLSNVRARNLEELILKARCADVDFIDDVVALSIIRDLRALGR